MGGMDVTHVGIKYVFPFSLVVAAFDAARERLGGTVTHQVTSEQPVLFAAVGTVGTLEVSSTYFSLQSSRLCNFFHYFHIDILPLDK